MDTPHTPNIDVSPVDLSPADLSVKPLNHCKNIPLEKMIALRKRGLSYDQIAKLCGCSKPNVIERLAKVQGEIDNIPHFKKYKDEVILLKQSKIINALTDAQIEKMAPRDKVLAFGILEDKLDRRSQANKPNLSINIRISPEQLKAMAQEMLDRGGQIPIDITPIDNESENSTTLDISKG